MKICRNTLCLFFCCTCLFAQQEATNWYFGENAGLSFATGTPMPLLDGQINTIEGCSTFSDANGNLLFYTEGQTVWNRDHLVMPNGTDLIGSFSTAQAALIVPNPENSELYYIFTPDDALLAEEVTTNGFHYTEVNMGLEDGFGDVSNKNIQLLPTCSEKVSAVRNNIENFYWVITYFQDSFYAYRIDGDGVDLNPVVSQTGPLIDGIPNIRGAIKISPDGSRLAMASILTDPEFGGSLYIFDFDLNTGLVTNPTLVDNGRTYYGVEFSPNSDLLYASGMNLNIADLTLSDGDYDVVQFDLELEVFPSRGLTLATIPNLNGIFVAGALQLALDKKIYYAFPNSRLSVLRAPNLKGVDAGFQLFSVDLGGRNAAFGLPPFIQSYFETIVTIENFCSSFETNFTLDNPEDISAINWNFGDPTSGTQNLSANLNPSHVYQNAGIYEVNFEVTYINGAIQSYTEFVEIFETPNVLETLTLVQCDSDGNDDGAAVFNLSQALPELTGGNEAISVLFFANTIDAEANTNVLEANTYNGIDGAVVYAKSFIQDDCFVISEVNLIVEPMSDLGVYDTITICDGLISAEGTTVDLGVVMDMLSQDFTDYDAIELYPSNQAALLEFDVIAQQNAYRFSPSNSAEVFFRVENDNACAFIGSVSLKVYEEAVYDENITLTLCKGEATLQTLTGFESYIWADGTVGNSLVVNQEGTYSVRFANDICSYTQTFEVRKEPPVVIEDILVDDFRANSSVTIILGANEILEQTIFSLDGGLSFTNSNSFSSLAPGIYNVVVDNGCAIFEQDIVVGGLAPFFTPNGDNTNDRWFLDNASYFPEYGLSIFDRYGKLLAALGKGQSGWDGNYQNQEMPSGDYWYRLRFSDGRTVTGNFALKR